MNADELLRGRLHESSKLGMLARHLDVNGAHPDSWDAVESTLGQTGANRALFDALEAARDELEKFAVIDSQGYVLAEPMPTRIRAVNQCRQLRAGGVYEVHPDGDEWTIVGYANWSYASNGGYRQPRR